MKTIVIRAILENKGVWYKHPDFKVIYNNNHLYWEDAEGVMRIIEQYNYDHIKIN